MIALVVGGRSCYGVERKGEQSDHVSVGDTHIVAGVSYFWLYGPVLALYRWYNAAGFYCGLVRLETILFEG